MPEITVYKILDSGIEAISVIPPPKEFRRLLLLSREQYRKSESIDRRELVINKKKNIPNTTSTPGTNKDRNLGSVLSDIRNLNIKESKFLKNDKKTVDEANEEENKGEPKKIGVPILPTSLSVARGTVRAGAPVFKLGSNVVTMSVGYVMSHQTSALAEIEENTGIYAAIRGKLKSITGIIWDIDRSHVNNRSIFFYAAVDTFLKISGAADRVRFYVEGTSEPAIVDVGYFNLGTNQMYLGLSGRFRKVKGFTVNQQTALYTFGMEWNDPTTWWKVGDLAIAWVGRIITILDLIRILTGLWSRLNSDLTDYKAIVKNPVLAGMLMLGNWVLAVTGAFLQSGTLTAWGYGVLLDFLMLYVTKHVIFGIGYFVSISALPWFVLPGVSCLIISILLGQCFIRLSTLINDYVKRSSEQDIFYNVPLETRNFKNKCETVKHPYGREISIVRRVLQAPDFKSKYPILSILSPNVGNTLLSYSSSWNLFNKHSGTFFYLGKNPEKITFHNSGPYVDFKCFSVRLKDITEKTRTDQLFFYETLVAVHPDEFSPIILFDEKCSRLFKSLTTNNMDTPLLEFSKYYLLVALFGRDSHMMGSNFYFEKQLLWDSSNSRNIDETPEGIKAFKLRKSLVSTIKKILFDNSGNNYSYYADENTYNTVLSRAKMPLSFVEFAPFNNPFVTFDLTPSSEKKLEKYQFNRTLMDDSWGYLVDYLLRVFCDPRIKYTTRDAYDTSSNAPGGSKKIDRYSGIINPPQVTLTNISERELEDEVKKVKYEYYELVNIYFQNLHQVLEMISTENLYYCNLTPRNLQTRYIPVNDKHKLTFASRFIKSIEGVNETNRGKVKTHPICAMPVFILPAMRSQFSVIDTEQIDNSSIIAEESLITKDLLTTKIIPLLLPHELPHIALLGLEDVTVKKLSQFILGVSIIDICLRTFYHTQVSPIQSITEVRLIGEEYNWMMSDRGPSFAPTAYLNDIQTYSIRDIYNVTKLSDQKYSIYFARLNPNALTKNAVREKPKDFFITSQQMNAAFKHFEIEKDESLMRTIKNFATYLSFFGSPVSWEYFKKNKFIGCRIITHIIKVYSEQPANSAWTDALNTDPLPNPGIWNADNSWCRQIVYNMLSQPGTSGGTMRDILEDYLSF